ncbi:hypothetical protein WJX84_004835, partial [Apatococcus fuscideae]
MTTISALTVYPVKGLKGIDLQQAQVTRTGLAFDRNWMVIDAASGQFLTQRELPRMALDQGNEAAEWLSDFLGTEVRLMRYTGQPDWKSNAKRDATGARRQVDPGWLRFAPEDEIAFQDNFPILMASEGALAALNSELDQPIPMNRFRPNVVVDDKAPWAEDSWDAMRISSSSGSVQSPAADGPSLELRLAAPASRCSVTTVNQASGERGKEPLKTLGKIRRGKQLGFTLLPEWKPAVFFGWNVVPSHDGLIAVGDNIEVVERCAQARDHAEKVTTGGRATAESRVVKAANRGGLQDAASEAFTAAKEQGQDAAVKLQNAAQRMGAHPAMQQAGGQVEGVLRQGQAAVQQGMGQMGEQGNAILRQGQTLGEQVQAQAGQFAQQLQGGAQQAQQAGQNLVRGGAETVQGAAQQVQEGAGQMRRGGMNGQGPPATASLQQEPSSAPLPTHSPADSSPVENRALLFTSEEGSATASGSMDSSLAGSQEPRLKAGAIAVLDSSSSQAGPAAASAVDVQMSEDPSPAGRPGATQPMGTSSAGGDALMDAEVQKVEEVAFRTAAAEASGNLDEARTIKDVAQPTPRQEREIEKKKADVKKQLRERRVPQSQIGRAWGFAGLGMNLAMGAVTSSVGNWFSGPQPDGPDGKPAYQGYLTEQNAEKLADALCRMRGAALKLGQMISIQDENILPPQFQAAMDR